MPRPYRRDVSRVALLTTAAADGHAHIAVFDDDGNGYTTSAAGHWHMVIACDVLPGGDGHAHELTTERRHVDGEGAGEPRPCTRRARAPLPRKAERRQVA